jgi:hypothetical protein
MAVPELAAIPVVVRAVIILVDMSVLAMVGLANDFFIN